MSSIIWDYDAIAKEAGKKSISRADLLDLRKQIDLAIDACCIGSGADIRALHRRLDLIFPGTTRTPGCRY